MASRAADAAGVRRRGIAIADDVAAFVLTLLGVVVTEVLASVAEPTFRGFFCDDRTIAYPALPSTVPDWALVFACLAVPLTAVLLGTLYQRFALQKESDQVTVRSHRRFGWLGRVIWYSMWMLIGLGLTAIATNILKLSRGELRPNFLDVCDPDFSTINCTDEHSLPVYVTNYTCRGVPGEVQDSRKSWPSGHASLSAYSFTFTALFVLSVTIVYPRSTIQLMVSGALLLLAVECGVSRIVDNKHHASDVIWGTIIGAFVAVVVVFYNLRLFTISGPGETPNNIPSYYRHHSQSPTGAAESNRDTSDVS